MNWREFFIQIKPGVPKRFLLFIAAFIWTMAGGILLARGVRMLLDFRQAEWIRVPASLLGGIVFYYFMFSKISLKHTRRIFLLPQTRPCAFSFFNLRSYILMGLMISMGISLRKFGLVPPEYLSVLYVAMGIPLALSALRFYHSGFFYHRIAG